MSLVIPPALADAIALTKHWGSWVNEVTKAIAELGAEPAPSEQGSAKLPHLNTPDQGSVG